jgi:16S rRNA (uracil1498-N3)-methyltransferase
MYSIDKEIEFRNGNGLSAVYSIKANSILGKKISEEHQILDERGFSLAMALPKAGKLDLILQKATELGIKSFHFIIFMQSERKEFNLLRCEKIIHLACGQSRRHSIPSLHLYPSLKNFLESFPKSIYFHPSEPTRWDVFEDTDHIPILGPEGGFRAEEIKLLKDMNQKGYNLGKNILRIETAAIYVSSLLHYTGEKK